MGELDLITTHHPLGCDRADHRGELARPILRPGLDLGPDLGSDPKIELEHPNQYLITEN